MDALQWDDLKGKLNLKTANLKRTPDKGFYYLSCLVFDEYLYSNRRGVYLHKLVYVNKLAPR